MSRNIDIRYALQSRRLQKTDNTGLGRSSRRPLVTRGRPLLKRPRHEELVLNDEPEWVDMGETESLQFLEQDDQDDIPEILEKVVESGTDDAITVSNQILAAIESAEPESQIRRALDRENSVNEHEPEPPVDPVLPEIPVDEFVEDFNEITLQQEEVIMAPPSRRSSVIDLSEEVPHPRSPSEMSKFTMAFALWCQTTGLTREHYSSLLEVLYLLDDIRTIKHLPRSISTLKRHIQEQLPLMKLRRQEISVAASRLPTQGVKDPARTAKEEVYFFDPISLFKTVLSSSSFQAKVHVGMANFVDEPGELYESMAWASSIKACSGEYATAGDDSDTIFPSDTVYYTCGIEDCFCQTSEDHLHLGRILAIGKDFTQSATIPGEFRVIINPLYTLADCGFDQADYPMSSTSTATELVVSNKESIHVTTEHILGLETNIHYDHRYEGNKVHLDRHAAVYTTNFIVRNVYDSQTRQLRALQLSVPIRGELELNVHGRQHLLNLAKSPCLSVPFLTFIDAFGLYRNMYRSILGIYITIAGLSWRERKRRANVLPLILGPHGSEFADIIKVLEAGLTALDGGVKMEVSGIETTVCAFTLAFVGDMKQQLDNSGFASPIHNRGCGKCSITKKHKRDLNFDIILNGRYHWRVLQERVKAAASRNAATYLNALGMQAEQTPLISITPALDIVRSRPTDAAHSEFAGIAKQAQSVLLTAILTPKGVEAYSAELRHFPFPPGWGRLQSLHHLKSYRMQECARLSIITPLLLRTCLEYQWIQPLYAKAVEITMCPTTHLDVVDSIVQAFAVMAKSNTVILAHKMTEDDRRELGFIMKASRKCFQRLYQCAALAASTSFKSGGTPTSSRASTPLPSSQGDSGEESDTTSMPEESVPGERGRSEYDILATEYTVEGPVSKKAKNYRDAMARPNVHAGLHFDEVAWEYATPNNVVTFSGEDKHRGFKADVRHTNFRDVTKVLLIKEAIYQTLRFVLAGSFEQSEQPLTAKLKEIHAHCPTLLNSLLPFSEKDLDDENESRLAVEGDDSHERVVGMSCVQRNWVQGQGWPLWPGKLAVNDRFKVMLEKAYEIDYDEPNVILPRSHGLQWCQKLAFTDRESEHRIVFKVGDFINVRGGQLARLDGVCLHELSRGHPRLFARVTLVEEFPTPKLDPVLTSSLLRLSKVSTVVGLPGIGSKKVYMLHVQSVRKSDRSLGGLKRGGTILLLHWDYDIQFM